MKITTITKITQRPLVVFVIVVALVAAAVGRQAGSRKPEAGSRKPKAESR
jgi:hypothetical protein